MLYTVKPGDTMAKIAEKFSIPLDRLVQANQDIEDINKIYVGQQLLIPLVEDEKIRTNQYTIKQINDLLIISFANKQNYKQGENVKLYLIKLNIGNSPLSFHYSTGQRFDFSATTNELAWNWSAGRSFIYQESDILIEPQDCQIYTANWNQKTNKGKQITGKVNITAWNVADRLEDERLEFSINIK